MTDSASLHIEAGGSAKSLQPRWVFRKFPPFAVMPALLLVGLVLLFPVISLIARSFFDPSFTLDNYTDLLTDSTSMTVLGRTLITALIVTCVTMLLAYPYAAAMCLVSDRLRIVLMALVLLPFWTSLMARTFAWLILLQDSGPVNGLLRAMGLPSMDLVGNTTGVILGMTHVMLPFMVLPIYSVISQIDLRLVQAAQSLGARPATAFAKVFLPLSLPGVFAGGTLVFIMSIGFYVTPAILGSPKESLIAQLIDTKITRLLDFAAGGALAALLIVVTLVLLQLVARFVNLSTALGVNRSEK